MPILFALILSTFASAHTLESVTVGGKDRAELVFTMKDAEAPPPRITISGNIIDLSFSNGVALSENAQQEWTKPHSLVQKMVLSTEDDKTLRARIVVSGSAEELKKRVRLEKEERLVRFFIDYPKGGALAASEELPIGALEEKGEKENRGRSAGMLILIFLAVLGGAVGTIFAIRASKRKGPLKGSRKFLIEQVAHHSLGNRSGVSLLKVGSEFVLVGITPQQITMLSALPGLEKRYEEEAQFEREHFKVAVEEEMGRIKPTRSSRMSA